MMATLLDGRSRAISAVADAREEDSTPADTTTLSRTGRPNLTAATGGVVGASQGASRRVNESFPLATASPATALDVQVQADRAEEGQAGSRESGGLKCTQGSKTGGAVRIKSRRRYRAVPSEGLRRSARGKGDGISRDEFLKQMANELEEVHRLNRKRKPAAVAQAALVIERCAARKDAGEQALIRTESDGGGTVEARRSASKRQRKQDPKGGRADPLAVSTVLTAVPSQPRRSARKRETRATLHAQPLESLHSKIAVQTSAGRAGRSNKRSSGNTAAPLAAGVTRSSLRQVSGALAGDASIGARGDPVLIDVTGPALPSAPIVEDAANNMEYSKEKIKKYCWGVKYNAYTIPTPNVESAAVGDALSMITEAFGKVAKSSVRDQAQGSVRAASANRRHCATKACVSIASPVDAGADPLSRLAKPRPGDVAQELATPGVGILRPNLPPILNAADACHATLTVDNTDAGGQNEGMHVKVNARQSPIARRSEQLCEVASGVDDDRDAAMVLGATIASEQVVIIPDMIETGAVPKKGHSHEQESGLPRSSRRSQDQRDTKEIVSTTTTAAARTRSGRAQSRPPAGNDAADGDGVTAASFSPALEQAFSIGKDGSESDGADNNRASETGRGSVRNDVLEEDSAAATALRISGQPDVCPNDDVDDVSIKGKIGVRQDESSICQGCSLSSHTVCLRERVEKFSADESGAGVCMPASAVVQSHTSIVQPQETTPISTRPTSLNARVAATAEASTAENTLSSPYPAAENLVTASNLHEESRGLREQVDDLPSAPNPLLPRDGGRRRPRTIRVESTADSIGAKVTNGPKRPHPRSVYRENKANKIAQADKGRETKERQTRISRAIRVDATGSGRALLESSRRATGGETVTGRVSRTRSRPGSSASAAHCRVAEEKSIAEGAFTVEESSDLAPATKAMTESVARDDTVAGKGRTINHVPAPSVDAAETTPVSATASAPALIPASTHTASTLIMSKTMSAKPTVSADTSVAKGAKKRGRRPSKTKKDRSSARSQREVDFAAFCAKFTPEPPLHGVLETPTPAPFLFDETDLGSALSKVAGAPVTPLSDLAQDDISDPIDEGASQGETPLEAAVRIMAAKVGAGSAHAVWQQPQHFVMAEIRGNLPTDFPRCSGEDGEAGCCRYTAIEQAKQKLEEKWAVDLARDGSGANGRDVGKDRPDSSGVGEKARFVDARSLYEGLPNDVVVDSGKTTVTETDTGGMDTKKGPHDERASSLAGSGEGKGKRAETMAAQRLRDRQNQLLDTVMNGDRSTDHNLIQPQEYGGKGGYFEDIKQPFRVEVHPNVHVVADLHSYMMDTAEIIGVLAGRFDESNNVLYVQAAVPCKEAPREGGDKGNTDVEFDLMSQFYIGMSLEHLGLQVVGWYHSHPKFLPHPSPIDIKNHHKTQTDEKNAGVKSPWVGLIVGRQHSPSTFRWFRNETVPRFNGEQIEDVPLPMHLHARVSSSVISSAAVSARRRPLPQADQEISPATCEACSTIASTDGNRQKLGIKRTLSDVNGNEIPPADTHRGRGFMGDKSGVLETGSNGESAGMENETVGGRVFERGYSQDKREMEGREEVTRRGLERRGVLGELHRRDVERKRKRARLDRAASDDPPISSSLGLLPCLHDTSKPSVNINKGLAVFPCPDKSARAPVASKPNGCTALISGGHVPSVSPTAESLSSALVAPISVTPNEASLREIGDVSSHLVSIGRSAERVPDTAGDSGDASSGPSFAAALGRSATTATSESSDGVPAIPSSAPAIQATSLLNGHSRDAPLMESYATGHQRHGNAPTAAAQLQHNKEVNEHAEDYFAKLISVGRGTAVAGADGGEAVEEDELYKAVGSLAQDPPLLFSKEVLEVLVGRLEQPENGIQGEGGHIGTGVAGNGGAGWVGGYGPEMKVLIQALVSLGRYYARLPRRAPFMAPSSAALEKLVRSLTPTIGHIELAPAEKKDFARDVALFLLTCFRETNATLAKRTTRKRNTKGTSGDFTQLRPARRSERCLS